MKGGYTLKYLTILTPFALSLLLVGCTPESEEQVETPNKPDTPVEQNDKVDVPKEDTVTLPEVVKPSISAMKEITIGMTKENVVELMGKEYKEKSFMYKGEAGETLVTPVPRVNLDYSVGGLVDGYSFDDSEGDVDIEGIFNKQRGNIVVVRLTDKNTVEYITSYYLNKEDNKLYEYRLFSDGNVKDHPIYPYPTEH